MLQAYRLYPVDGEGRALSAAVDMFAPLEEDDLQRYLKLIGNPDDALICDGDDVIARFSKAGREFYQDLMCSPLPLCDDAPEQPSRVEEKPKYHGPEYAPEVLPEVGPVDFYQPKWKQAEQVLTARWTSTVELACALGVTEVGAKSLIRDLRTKGRSVLRREFGGTFKYRKDQSDADNTTDGLSDAD